MVVYSHFQFGEDKGPSLYFYSLNQGKDVLKIKGGEALIDYIPEKDDSSKADEND